MSHQSALHIEIPGVFAPGIHKLNTLIYFIISLIAYRLQNPIPMLLLVCMQISVIIIFTLLSKNTYNNIYPPRRVLMIYGNDSPESLINKIPLEFTIYDNGYTKNIKGTVTKIDSSLNKIFLNYNNHIFFCEIMNIKKLDYFLS